MFVGVSLSGMVASLVGVSKVLHYALDSSKEETERVVRDITDKHSLASMVATFHRFLSDEAYP